MDRRAFLTFGLLIFAGCAQRADWIGGTLVTVDVTGTWQGTTIDGWFELVLEQQGPKVTGSALIRGLKSSGNAISGPIDGVVRGDEFTFRQTNGRMRGATKVSGDEMSGQVQVFSSAPILLRRVK